MYPSTTMKLVLSIPVSQSIFSASNNDTSQHTYVALTYEGVHIVVYSATAL